MITEANGSPGREVEQSRAVLTNATRNIDEYLKTPEEQVLREHQFDVMGAIRDSWSRGESEGYISLPPSAGKTVIYSQLARVSGLRALVLTPTLTTLDQGSKEFQARAPEIAVSEYHSGTKDLSGDVVITTYQSALNLVQSGKLNPHDFDLLIPDELHLGLGEIRHQLYRYFNHALKLGVTATPSFDQIEGYVKRGLVERNEQWLNLFQNCIYEMGLEEAMERKISAQADVYLTRTDVKVDDIDIASDGDYSVASIERALDRHARNMMTIAIVAGPEFIPSNVHFNPEKLQELSNLHEKVKGKSTAIFGLSIEHVNALAETLREKGITAEAVHSRVDPEKRKEILVKHRSGDVQVVLGVDALRVGWDSPETKVGIYMAPTRSGVVALQEFGRITRPYEDQRATAIQFVDDFVYRGQAPVLIPNLFDPEYVLRSFVTGLEKKHTDEKRSEKPIVTFSGLHIESTIEEARSNELIQRRFKRGSIDEMAEIIDRVVEETAGNNVGATSLEFFQEIQKALPVRMPVEKQEEAVQALASIDSNIAQKGKNILLYTNIGAIMSVIQPYLSRDKEKNEALFHAAMQGVLEKLSNLKTGEYIKGAIRSAAGEGVVEFLGDEHGIPAAWIRGKAPQGLLERAQVLTSPKGLSHEDLTQVATDLAEEFGLNRTQVFNYLNLYTEELMDKTDKDEPLDREVSSRSLAGMFGEALQTLAPREQKIIYGRFAEGKTLKEVGRDQGVTSERIQTIQARALRKLRQPEVSNKFIDFVTSARTDKMFYKKRPSYKAWLILNGYESLESVVSKYMTKRLAGEERNLTGTLDAIKDFGSEFANQLSKEGVSGAGNYRWDARREEVFDVLKGKRGYFDIKRVVIDWHRRNKRGPYSYESLEQNYTDTNGQENFYISTVRKQRRAEGQDSIAHLDLDPNTFLTLIRITNSFSEISPDLNLATISSLKHALDINFLPGNMVIEIRYAIEQFERLKSQTQS